ncbi:GIY-YIG nuclease family protein [Photobacterium indicum]
MAHYIAVDNCKKFESLVHSKLAPLRQKRREFFNLNSDDAHVALISILDNQSEIKKINEDKIVVPQEMPTTVKHRKTKRKNNFKRIDSEYADLLQSFSSVLNVKGRSFGQLNKPTFGMSDGYDGVQWNLSVSTDTGAIKLGINLEGMKYVDWPISKFIQSEISNPQIFAIRERLSMPKNVFIRFTRDAWQVTARPNIVEKYLGGKEYCFADINATQWSLILNEALECLNKKADYRGRAVQDVTLENQSGENQVRTMTVSPHLTIWSPLSTEGNVQENILGKLKELKSVYDWVKRISHN